MKLDDLLKNDSIESIVDADSKLTPQFAQPDNGSEEALENKLKSFKEARERYFEERNNTMVVKMDERIREYERRIKELNISRSRSY